jgi:DNA polymerase-1
MTQPNLLILETPQDIKTLQEYLEDKDIITYDTETTGVTNDSEIIGFSVCAEDNLAAYVILAAYNPETKLLDYYPENKKAAYDLIKSLQKKSLVMHNAIFDCMITEAYFKISLIDSLHTDTMVLAHLLNENRRIGLKELGVELFGDNAANEAKEMKESVAKNGGTLTKSNYEMWKADAQLMAKYGAKDALLTYKIFIQLVTDLYDQGLDKFFYEDESMPLLKGSTYQLNTTGLKVDIQGLQTLKKQLEAECFEAKNFIYEEIKNYIKDKYPATTKKNVFNIGSSSQLAWLIFGELGLEYSTLTKEGKNVCKHLIGKLPYSISAKAQFVRECLAQVGGMYIINEGKPKKIKEPWAYIACDKNTLKKLAPKYKWIEKLLEYQRKTKILTTYVKGISDKTKYGLIHPNFLQTGTTSGRYSSRNPNFQNLPRDDKRIKQCIIARPNKVFVGADYSQLEPRVFSYLSQDKNLMAAFNGTDDFYSVIGMRVYGKTDCTPQKEGSPDAFGVKYKKLRDLSKVIALATVYGATANQLSSTTGKNTEDTQEDIDTYLNEFEGVKKLMTGSHLMAKTKGYVENIFGRKRRMPEATKIDRIYGKLEHKDLPYEARSLLNLSTNHRVQSTGASIVNRAAIRFNELCKEVGIKANLVCQVHDSLIAECDEADGETVSLLLQEAMETTTILEGVPLEAVPKIGKNLAEV